MIKTIVKPFQDVLLSKRLCPGCTHPLDKIEKTPFKQNKAIGQCKCKRRYIQDLDTNTYRRATLEEEREYIRSLSK